MTWQCEQYIHCGMQMVSDNQLTISLIIPCYNDTDAVNALLTQIQSFNIDEVIVVDGGSYDGSQNRVRQFENVILLSSKKGRGRQIATGIASAKCDIIWILHADSQVPVNAISEIKRIMSLPNTAFGCFSLRFDKNALSLKLFAGLSKIDSVLTTFGDQGYFCYKEHCTHFGNGASYPLLEDVVLRRFLLRTTNGRVRKSPAKITTSARRFRRHGPVKTQLLNARILWRYFRGVSPIKLYDEYYRKTSDQLLSDQTASSGYSNP